MEAVLKYFAPGDCYEVFFVNFNIFDGKEICATVGSLNNRYYSTQHNVSQVP